MLGKLKSKFINWLLKDVHLDEIHIGEHSVVISGTGANMDGQKIENVGAPDSDDDVPRRVFSDLTGRWTLAQAHRGADGRILVFKGAAADPIELDTPFGMSWNPIWDSQQYVSWDGTWLNLRLVKEAGADTYANLVSFSVMPYGTYEAKAYCENSDANAEMFLFMLETMHSPLLAVSSELITIKDERTTPKFLTRVAAITETSVVGVVTTAEHTHKFEWAADNCKYYYDGALKAEHTTNVPSHSLALWIEIFHKDVTTSDSFVHLKEFRKVA